MAIHTLKFRDSRPVLEVFLKNPDATAYDLTGATIWKLHVLKNDKTIFTRDMVVTGSAALGCLRYTWVAADWVEGTAGGFLIAGPTLPLAVGAAEHQMEYEIIGPSTVRATFPNDGFDTLRVTPDIAQG